MVVFGNEIEKDEKMNQIDNNFMMVKTLFERLHHCPEVSGQEKETKEIFMCRIYF